MISYRYWNSDEYKDLLCYYLTHEDKREAIALAGQQRMLSENNYYCRMKDLAEVVSKHLRADGIHR
jgi:spore maturation protein CgeB